ncbi:NAD(P)-dependent dehydrogenase, short-chain alcohol dehydrogenase family [Seinonella peptonophila]|uniref:NAD(P)-dependent dehydrogenase, short-chain alcohol dehydrogenase family n=1 Tax=Seinonella peptonophila TaxID=112248 RepID=A0A1M4U9B9_9BACL|nr:SDR family oxidoreductase [Seinonella peptonophila]SHE53382.1 NAD(P)-dependent dehydrogenase, short-chain alcohol dehydrogenase family [Seinonella peptonophila]
MYPHYPPIGKIKKCKKVPRTFPPQHQMRQPGYEYLLDPPPIFENPHYVGTNKLCDQVAIITGGDSGIGRAVAVAYAKEGADIVIAYLDEHIDAEFTKNRIEELGRHCILIPGDLRKEEHSTYIVNKTVELFGKVDIVVNNHGVQYPQKDLMDISAKQLRKTFETNIFPFFYLTKAALPYMKKGSCIINTTSVTAYRGEPTLIDYSSTKGAIVSFTRSLALNLVKKCIRVNAVAPGPIWTPLNPSSYPAKHIETFGAETPMKRAGQPFELAPAYVYLASEDSNYVTGEVIHINGGEMVTT